MNEQNAVADATRSTRGRPPLPIEKRKRLTRAEIDAPLSPRGLHRPDDPEYHKALTAVLLQTHSLIESAVYDQNPNFGFAAVDWGMRKLYERCHMHMHVSIDDEAVFCEYAIRYVSLWAQRYQRWQDIIRNPRYRRSVKAGAEKSIGAIRDRLGAETVTLLVAELAEDSELMLWLFCNMNERPPSKRRKAAAPVSTERNRSAFTRIQARAYWVGRRIAGELLAKCQAEDSLDKYLGAVDSGDGRINGDSLTL